MSINPVTVAYLALLAGAAYALWQAMPHSPAEWRYPVGSLGRLGSPDIMRTAQPEEYWPEHIGVTESSEALTEQIERIEARPDTPALLSQREEREREDAAYAAFFAEFDAAIETEIERFNTALEPTRQILSAWHRESRYDCQRCERIAAATTRRHLASALRIPYAGA